MSNRTHLYSTACIHSCEPTGKSRAATTDDCTTHSFKVGLRSSPQASGNSNSTSKMQYVDLTTNGTDGASSMRARVVH